MISPICYTWLKCLNHSLFYFIFCFCLVGKKCCIKYSKIWKGKFGALKLHLCAGSEKGSTQRIYCMQPFLAFLSETVSKAWTPWLYGLLQDSPSKYWKYKNKKWKDGPHTNHQADHIIRNPSLNNIIYERKKTGIPFEFRRELHIHYAFWYNHLESSTH